MVDVRTWSYAMAMRVERNTIGESMARRAPSILEDVDMGTGSQRNATLRMRLQRQS
jgi:hypothetical protein